MNKIKCIHCGKGVSVTPMPNGDIEKHEPATWDANKHLLKYGDGADVGLCACGATVLKFWT